MAFPSAAIVGAAESTRIGAVPELSSLGLAIDAATNALHDAGLKPSAVDGLAVSYMPPADLCQLLGIRPGWVDGTVVGGCSPMYQLRNAAAAIQAGYCNTVLILYGESGRSHGAMPCVYDVGAPGSIGQQFDIAYGGQALQPALFSLPLVRYMRDFGLSIEQLASVAVAQRKWAQHNPRAKLQEPIGVDDVLASPIIAWPLHRAMCCLVSDAGGAIIVTSAERARDFPKPAAYLLGGGAAVETGVISPAGVRDPLRPPLIKAAGDDAFHTAGVGPSDIDHLMVYDAFAHNPIFALEGLGFTPTGAAGAFIEEGATSPGGKLPMNTNGGGLSYAHSGSYGLLCMLESIRQIRGDAACQLENVEISMAFGWGGFWSACAAVVFGREPKPRRTA